MNKAIIDYQRKSLKSIKSSLEKSMKDILKAEKEILTAEQELSLESQNEGYNEDEVQQERMAKAEADRNINDKEPLTKDDLIAISEGDFSPLDNGN